MTVVDSNVILDIFVRDERWAMWSAEQLAIIGESGEAIVNPIVLAELSPNFGALAILEGKLALLGIEVVPIPAAAAFMAGQRFTAYRRMRDTDIGRRVLPDFFIGAHAAAIGAPLLTRDAALYRRYFPDLPLITPA